MNIGTAKPRQSKEYFLTDLVFPNEVCSAFEFKRRVKNLIPSIVEKGKLPVVSGGSFFYYKMLAETFNGLPAKNQYLNHTIFSKAVRKNNLLSDWMVLSGGAPQDSSIVARNLLKILVQFGVLVLQPGRTFHTHQFLPIILVPSDINQLKHRMVLRLENMLDNGLVEEVMLLKRKYKLNLSSHSAKLVGYKQVLSYLDGAETFGMMKFKTLVSTFELAKKQLGWIRSLIRFASLDCCQAPAQLLQRVQEILSSCLVFNGTNLF